VLRAGYRGSCARAVSSPRYNIELVFEEIVANIVSHGAADGREVDVHTMEGRNRLSVKVSRAGRERRSDGRGFAGSP
jgi:hypothetical protein